MRPRHIASESALSIKPLIQRGLVVAIIALSLFLLFSERSENGFASSVRMTLMDGVVPVMKTLSQPVEAFHSLTEKVNDMFYVYAENRRLRIENQRLLQWQTTATKLQAESEALRELLHYKPNQNQSFVTAKVVGSVGNSLSHRVMLDVGYDQGVRKHHAVMNGQGLVGRVVNVGPSSTEVLLITDLNSRIPIMTEANGIRSILAGNRSDMPALSFYKSRQKPSLGDVVLTSADGDLFPAGLPVGKLFSEQNGQWFVRPFADTNSLRYVYVVDYNAEKK